MTDEPKRVDACVFGDGDGDSISVDLHVTNMQSLTDALGGIESELGKTISVHVSIEDLDVGLTGIAQALNRIADAILDHTERTT